jgi:hypothetical protein
MNLPDLPPFDIPPECRAPRRDITTEEYDAWVLENVRLLHEQGLYRKLQDAPSRTPSPEPFRYGESE